LTKPVLSVSPRHAGMIPSGASRSFDAPAEAKAPSPVGMYNDELVKENGDGEGAVAKP
jgi:hypothetical protein